MFQECLYPFRSWPYCLHEMGACVFSHLLFLRDFFDPNGKVGNKLMKMKLLKLWIINDIPSRLNFPFPSKKLIYSLATHSMCSPPIGHDEYLSIQLKCKSHSPPWGLTYGSKILTLLYFIRKDPIFFLKRPSHKKACGFLHNDIKIKALV